MAVYRWILSPVRHRAVALCVNLVHCFCFDSCSSPYSSSSHLAATS